MSDHEYIIIGASLSEPHIDDDVRPTSRGMFVYMYVSGRVVRLSSLCSHVASALVNFNFKVISKATIKTFLN